MVELLRSILPDEVVDNIEAFMPEDPEYEWETVYGSTRIYQTNHTITYGGGPEGGYVYFYREREPGWYSWHRDWGTEPTYTKIDGKLIQTFDDYVEKVAVVPLDWEPNDEENEDITILDDYIMESQD